MVLVPTEELDLFTEVNGALVPTEELDLVTEVNGSPVPTEELDLFTEANGALHGFNRRQKRNHVGIER